jgi:hypothetical protein
VMLATRGPRLQKIRTLCPVCVPDDDRRAPFLAAASQSPSGDQILVRMTHRHFAIFRSRVKPYCAYNSSGPVCR